MPIRRSRSILALSVLLAACTGTPSTDTTTTLTAVPTTEAAPPTSDGDSSSTATPPTTGQVIEWRRIDDPVFDGGFLDAVVEAGPGLVAVGTDEVPEDAAAWVSPDGTEWERIESPSFAGIEDENGLDGTQFMRDVVVGPAGIVAVGGYERREARDLDPAVWISPDGRSWERVVDPDFERTGDGHLDAIVEWNGTYVAVGESPAPVGSGERRPAIWVSADARDWARVTGLALQIDGVITDITDRGTRLVAVGSTGHVLRPAVWFSEDGVAWDLVTADGDPVVGSIDIGTTEDLDDMFMLSIAVTRNGFVAAGGIGFPSQVAFWESPDGRFWTLTGVAADAERATIPVVAEGLVTTGDAIVAVGNGPLATTRFPPLSFAEVWLSFDDGTSWAQLPRTSGSLAVTGPDAPWHIGSMRDVISFRDGLVAVGYVPSQDPVFPGPFYRQAVWIGGWIAS